MMIPNASVPLQFLQFNIKVLMAEIITAASVHHVTLIQKFGTNK
jgi:hypothetical protein